MNASVREHMEVVGSDGVHVGTVDRLERGRIRIVKGDAVDGRFRLVPADWVVRIDDKVRLDRPSAEALRDIEYARDPIDAGRAVKKDGVVGFAGAVLFRDEAPHDE